MAFMTVAPSECAWYMRVYRCGSKLYRIANTVLLARVTEGHK